MAKFGEFIVVYNILPEVAERMLETLEGIVNKAAFDIQATAQANAVVGPTSFLKNSIYTVVGSGKNAHPYSDVQAPQEGQEQLPEVAAPKKYQAVIAVAANYGLFVEMGTVHMGARPFLTPAVETVRPSYDKALALLEAKMAGLSIPTGDTSGGMGGVQ